MKQEVVIRLINIKEQLWLTGKVDYMGRTYYITKSGKYFADELPKGEEVFTYIFSLSNPTYKITWDDTPHREPDQAKQGRLARVMDETYRMIATLWQYHKQIKVTTSTDPEINKGKKGVRFLYEHINKRHTTKLAEIKKRAKVVNNVLDIDVAGEDTLIDLAYYFLPAVSTKKHSEIVVALIDKDSGYLLQEPQMSEFLNHYKTSDPNIIYLTYIKKAIGQKIIEDKKESGMWLYKQYVGSHLNAVMDYLKNNKQVYEAMQRDVRNGEPLYVEDVLDEKKMKEENNEKLIEDHNTIEDLRKIAKELGIKTWHNAGEVKLRASIEEVKRLQGA